MAKMPKTSTLYEIRRSRSMGSDSMGCRKLRTGPRARRLARFLKSRYGVQTVLHSWKVAAA